MADGAVYVNVAEGSARIMNNIKLYVKLLTKFRNDNNLNDLEAAVAAGDLAKAQSAAHTVKGVAANLALSELFKQCLELETQIKGGTVNPAQMETVKTVFAATLKEIDKVTAENG
jgi:HPt (histidine-containing phosphotransfer) domain-containing protein